MVDKESIFNLFEDDINNPKSSLKDKGLKSSYIKVGMFVKLIQNHEVFHQRLLKFLNKEQPNYNIEPTKKISEFTVYNKAWSYLNQIDLNNEEDVASILKFNPKYLNNSLRSALTYYEDKEEYLKCALIFKIQELLKEKNNN